MGRYYTEFSDFLALHFPGRKIQKLTVDAGLTCPNRDGTLSTGGCAYCNNISFSPGGAEGRALPLEQQIEQSRRFFARKYPAMKYLVYFQSYTNTYGDVETLLDLYDRALAADSVEGIVIGTRPDMLPDRLLDELARRRRQGKWIMIELGAESTHNETLRRVNRCHDWQATVDAVSRIKAAGLPVGLHLIMGLPGEDTAMMLESARRAALRHPDTIKFHQLQIIEGSTLGREWLEGKRFPLFTPEEYIPLCCRLVEIFNTLSPATAIERFTSQAPADLLIAPRWGLKNYQFVNLLHHSLPPLNPKLLNS